MEYRRTLLQNKSDEIIEQFPVYEDVACMYEESLCQPENFYKLKCLKRECLECGVHMIRFLPEELDQTNTETRVQWEKFEYCNVNGKGGKIFKKLVMVKKETTPGEMFAYMKELLQTFPLHQHKVQWQNEQFRHLTSNLPQGACVCVHDFSENCRCSERKELQSTYVQKTEVTVHATIIYRHSIMSYDGIESTEDEPKIRQEYFYVISPDIQHDQYFVREVRHQIKHYLDSIGYTCHTMHEYTDGCASQYKSRHCFGEISNPDELGYTTFTRNFFETSHAKGMFII